MRRTLLWTDSSFVAVAVIGLALVPALTLVWSLVLVFGIAAVPQAFLRRP